MYRAEIDGLRAVAVLSVIINHIDKIALPNGYLGVDIFYVISGYVITQSLISREHSTFGSYLLDFYRRRVKRLVPALFLCITITIIFVLLVTAPGSSVSVTSLRTGITALFGFSNLYLLRQATDYFGSSAEINAFTHTWSLGVEEQFYLLFPFFLWFSGIAPRKTRGFRNFSILICITTIISLISYLWANEINPTVAFYLMPTRFWELASGAIVFLALLKLPPTSETYSRFIQYITLAALLSLIAVFFLSQQLSQSLATFSAVTLTAFLIFGIQPRSLVYKILTSKFLVFIGVISYSLYLYHWSVLTISRLTIGVDCLTIPFQLAVIFLLSFMSYQLVERPLRRADWSILWIGRLRIHEIGYAITVALGMAVVVLLIAAPLHKQGYVYLGNVSPLIKKGVSTLKDRNTYNEYSWQASRCILSSNKEVGKVINPLGCTFGNFSTASRRFLVIGSSFSAAEIEMYKILVAKERGSVTITSSWGASAVPDIENKSAWNKANSYYWESVIPSLVNRLLPGDVLLMINDGSSFSPKKFEESSRQRLKTLLKGLERITGEMLKRGIFVIYQSGNPFMRESNCTPDAAAPQWWQRGANHTPCTYYTREESLERRRMYHDSLKSLENKFSNFAILDLFDVFCPGNLCTFFNDKGTFLYRDEYSHPSVEASIYAQPVLLETVDRLIKKSKSSDKG